MWLDAVVRARDTGERGVLVTVVGVHGHAPRDAGAKMVVTDGGSSDTIGGGNLEAVAVETARRMLAEGASQAQLVGVDLSDRAPLRFGVQCCGGRVQVLLEPLG